MWSGPACTTAFIGLATIAEFVSLTWIICVWETHTSAKVMMIVFSVFGIISSVSLIVGGFKLSRKFLIPYLCVMSAFVLMYIIVFPGTLDRRKDEIKADWKIMEGNVTFLIVVFVLYWLYLPNEQPDPITEPLLGGN